MKPAHTNRKKTHTEEDRTHFDGSRREHTRMAVCVRGRVLKTAAERPSPPLSPRSLPRKAFRELKGRRSNEEQDVKAQLRTQKQGKEKHLHSREAMQTKRHCTHNRKNSRVGEEQTD